MDGSAREEVGIRYVRWKAVAFGSFMLALGCLTLWVAAEALDPAWEVPGNDGKLLQFLPVWIRMPFMAAMGVVILSPGLVMLWSGLADRTVVLADSVRISARTIFGRRRELPWSQIIAAKRKQNQIVLSPAGADSIGQEIWDRKSVLLDIGMLAEPEKIEALIRSRRPDLVIGHVDE